MYIFFTAINEVHKTTLLICNLLASAAYPALVIITE